MTMSDAPEFPTQPVPNPVKEVICQKRDDIRVLPLPGQYEHFRHVSRRCHMLMQTISSTGGTTYIERIEV
jgi:hypothetical protein